jgi:galactonate dehydratase
MKIAEVEPLRVGSQLYVRITTDDGLRGLGQSACWAYPDAVRGVLEAFRSYLVGQDPMRIEHHWQYLYRMGPFRGSVLGGAVSAVDIALWDIKGQRLGVPIWELLGGRTRDRIRLHLLIGGADPPAIHAAARRAAADGFTAIKFDPVVAGYQDMSTDALVASIVDMVAAAREAVGRDVDVILELHRKLSPVQAVPVAEAVARFHPLFFEDPVQIDSIMSQAEIARRVSVAAANGERLHSIWEFRELLCAGGAQFVRPDVGLAGGLSQTKKIAAIAESFHAGVALHNFLGPVLTTASAHLDVAIPNFAVQEYSLVDESPAASVFDGVLERRGGYLAIPERPGLGIRLDDAKLAGVEPSSMLGPIPLRADGSVAYSV